MSAAERCAEFLADADDLAYELKNYKSGMPDASNVVNALVSMVRECLDTDDPDMAEILAHHLPGGTT